MSVLPTLRRLSTLLAASVAVAGMVGCGFASPTPTSFPLANGNWQFVAAQSTPTLPALSGSLSGPSTNVTGLLHVDGAGACVQPSDVIEVTGWANQYGVMNLTGTLAGGTLSIQGVLAADGKSLVESGYSVAGGSCSLSPTHGAGQYYQAIKGSYSGTIKDASGMSSILTATFSQSPNSDVMGNFTLSGQGSFVAYPCLTGTAQVTNTKVTGNTLELTYVDPSTQGSVDISGQFSPDGTTLTFTKWTQSGHCGSDTGTGLLVQSQSAQ